MGRPREFDLDAAIDLAIRAQSGATHKDLCRMIDGMLADWPVPKEA
ncbi:hypothetical protein GWG65_29840 [Bradyrhizobium sp. CSA207]|nr:hypothetical protein [Bradyrhizobium sp. CSA207]MDE5445554.1 hypothetical protein [Bradyrhizobium sp. CSA207]